MSLRCSGLWYTQSVAVVSRSWLLQNCGDISLHTLYKMALHKAVSAPQHMGYSNATTNFVLQDAHIRNPSLRSLNAYGWQHHAQASHASALQQPHHSAGSYVGQPNASVCEVEPFSDDDDVTVLDTTEIIKQTYPLDMLTQHTNSDHFRTQSVPPPPLQSPSRKPQSPQSPNLQSLHSDGYSLVDSSHLDSASDLVFEITPNSSEYFTPNSSSSSHSPNNSHSPESFAQAQQQQQPVQRIYSVYDSDPQLLSTIPEYEGRSQHLSSGSSHGKHVDGIYATHSSGKSLNIVQPSEFREMVDQLIASGEHQAVQNQAPQHMRSGGAEQLHSSGGMHPIWEDEEDCHMRDMPCRATIGGLATV